MATPKRGILAILAKPDDDEEGPGEESVGAEDRLAAAEECVAALKSGDCLVMFPEGTRTRPGEPMHFHRGTASVAVRGAAVLTPVYIRVDQPFLHKTQSWYQVPPRRPNMSIRVGDDIDLEPYRRLPPPRASRQLNASLLEHYGQELGRDAGYNGTSRD